MKPEILKSVLAAHAEWLAAGKPENDPRIADLEGADLNGAKL